MDLDFAGTGVVYRDRLVEVPGPERIVEVEKLVEVPGPERIIEVEKIIAGPERVVEVEKLVEVPGPERIVEVPVEVVKEVVKEVIKEVPGPERFVKIPVEVIKEVVKEVPGPVVEITKTVEVPVKERVEVPVYRIHPGIERLLEWAAGTNKLAAVDDTSPAARKTTFGIEFPRNANRGDFFLRVDDLPSRLFKYNGDKWIEVSKDQNGSYLNDDYVLFLVERLTRGEIDIDQLTEDEVQEVKALLQKDQPLKNI